MQEQSRVGDGLEDHGANVSLVHNFAPLFPILKV